MNIFYSIMSIMYLILGLFVVNNICTLFHNIAKKYYEESKFIELQRIKEELKPVSKELDYLDKVEATIGLLNFINVLIDNEINNMMTSLSKINSKYELIKLDEDAKNIATNIFQAIAKDNTFIENNLIVTNDYVMKYITDESIIKLLDKATKYNSKISLVV